MIIREHKYQKIMINYIVIYQQILMYKLAITTQQTRAIREIAHPRQQALILTGLFNVASQFPVCYVLFPGNLLTQHIP